MTSLWSNDVVFEFLDLYRREQVIWDSNHPLHKNRREVGDAWNRIQSSLSVNCTVIDLKKKKESLMTAFRNQVNKKKALATYQPSWFAYSFMESFLGAKYECDSTQTVSEMEQEFFTTTSSYDGEPKVLEHGTTKQTDNKRIIAVEKQTDPPVAQRNVDDAGGGRNSKFVYVKKHTDDAPTRLKNASADQNDGSDEYDLYGQLLAKKLRKLDERQRDVAMHEIDNIMFRAKMQSTPSQKKSYCSPGSPPSRRTQSPVFVVTQESNEEYEEENNLTY